MKRFLMAVVAIAALLTGAVVSAAPASAAPTVAVVSTTAEYEPHPATINGYRFWSPSICIDGSAINGPYYRVAYIAQQWNLKTSGLALDYSDDCVADGYPPSRRMVIGMFSSNDPDQGCTLGTNLGVDFYNGMYRWTDGPGVYLKNDPLCNGSQTRRDHLVSAAIGSTLGLKILNSSGYNSRVVNMTLWSWDNVPLPDVNSGVLLADINAGVYGG